MTFLFEKLAAYNKALSFAVDIRNASRGISSSDEDISKQLKRAAVSISVNIAEGNGRWHKKDRKYFFQIARGSIFECAALIELCNRLKIFSDKETIAYKSRLEELSKMLSGLINNIDTKRIVG